MKTSVVTIAHKRESAIRNLLAGLEKNTCLPDELVVVHMNEESYNLHSEIIPIRKICYYANTTLPLAAARNAAIANATCEHVIFLDADCIPGVDLVSSYINAFKSADVLWSGRVKYLTQSAMEDVNLLNKLSALSEQDPIRGSLQMFTYELFWSLNFGCSKSVFNEIGGFDELFTGYGAEDTDFAFSARLNNVKLHTVDAFAFHQYHPSYDPPLNHMEDIVKNAEQFKVKWKCYPMEGWLRKFKNMNFIEMTSGGIKILRKPSEAEISRCLKPA